MTSSPEDELRRLRSEELDRARALDVQFDDDYMTVELADGRRVSVPLDWFPRLRHGTADERSHWTTSNGGQAIHWDDLDESLGVDHLLLGRRSYEGDASLQAWLAERRRQKAGRS